MPRPGATNPKGALCASALSCWPALTLYVDDGTVEIDNNAAEQVLRGWRWGAEAGSLRVLRLTVQTPITRSNKAGAGRLPTGRQGTPAFEPGGLRAACGPPCSGLTQGGGEG